MGCLRRCRIYDKSKEANGRPGSVTRVEWELRDPALRQEFGSNAVGISQLLIENCYQAYRRLCQDFAPIRIPAFSRRADFFALLEHEKIEVRGVPAFDLLTRGMHPKSVRRLRREVQGRKWAEIDLDWRQLLPERFEDFQMIDAL